MREKKQRKAIDIFFISFYHIFSEVIMKYFSTKREALWAFINGYLPDGCFRTPKGYFSIRYDYKTGKYYAFPDPSLEDYSNE